MHTFRLFFLSVLFYISIVEGGVEFFRSRIKGDPATGREPQSGYQYDLPYLINNDNKVDFRLNITGYPDTNFSRCFHDDDWLRWGPGAEIWAGDRYGVNNCKITWPAFAPQNAFSINARARLSNITAGSRIKADFEIVIPQFRWKIDCPACGGQCIIKIPVVEKIYNITMPKCPINWHFDGLPGMIPLDLLPADLWLHFDKKLFTGPISLFNPDNSLSFQMDIRFGVKDTSVPPKPGIDPVIPGTTKPPAEPEVFETDFDSMGTPMRRFLSEGDEYTTVMQVFSWIGHAMDQLMDFGGKIKQYIKEVEI